MPEDNQGLNKPEPGSSATSDPAVGDNRRAGAFNGMVPWYHIFHSWTKWEDYGEKIVSENLNPLTGELLASPVVAGKWLIQTRHCVVCGAKDFRDAHL